MQSAPGTSQRRLWFLKYPVRYSDREKQIGYAEVPNTSKEYCEVHKIQEDMDLHGSPGSLPKH